MPIKLLCMTYALAVACGNPHREEQPVYMPKLGCEPVHVEFGYAIDFSRRTFLVLLPGGGGVTARGGELRSVAWCESKALGNPGKVELPNQWDEGAGDGGIVLAACRADRITRVETIFQLLEGVGSGVKKVFLYVEVGDHSSAILPVYMNPSTPKQGPRREAGGILFVRGGETLEFRSDSGAVFSGLDSALAHFSAEYRARIPGSPAPNARLCKIEFSDGSNWDGCARVLSAITRAEFELAWEGGWVVCR